MSDALDWFANPLDYKCIVCRGQATALIGNMVVKDCNRIGICDRCAVLLLSNSMKEVKRLVCCQ